MVIWGFRGVSIPLSEDQLKGLLQRYDTNGDRRLSRKELKSAFRSLGMKHCGSRSSDAFKHADANGDGFITEEELNQLVKFAYSKWGFTIS